MPGPRRAAVYAAFGLAALAAAWPLLLKERDETARIAAVLDAVIAGLEARDAGDIMAHIAADYHDAAGLRRDTLYRWLVANFFRHRTVRVTRLGRTVITLTSPQRATATLTAAVSEGFDPRALRRAGVWAVEVDLALDDDRWQITGHRRRRIR